MIEEKAKTVINDQKIKTSMLKKIIHNHSHVQTHIPTVNHALDRLAIVHHPISTPQKLPNQVNSRKY